MYGMKTHIKCGSPVLKLSVNLRCGEINVFFYKFNELALFRKHRYFFFEQIECFGSILA